MKIYVFYVKIITVNIKTENRVILPKKPIGGRTKDMKEFIACIIILVVGLILVQLSMFNHINVIIVFLGAMGTVISASKVVEDD